MGMGTEAEDFMVTGHGGTIAVGGIYNIIIWSGPSFQILFGTRAFWIWNRFGTQPVRRSGTLELSRMVWNDFRRHPLSLARKMRRDSLSIDHGSRQPAAGSILLDVFAQAVCVFTDPTNRIG
jgi:hypothetical protein